MGSYDQHWGCGFEAYPSLDADYGVTHVHITSNSVCRSYPLHFLNCRYAVVIVLAVDRSEHSLLESQAQDFAPAFLHLLEVCALRQTTGGVEDLATADRGAPDANVIGVLEFCKIGFETMRIEVIHLLLAAEIAVAGEGDDFHIGAHYEEGHIKTDLVVAGTGGTVGNGVSANFVGVAGYSHSLEDAL